MATHQPMTHQHLHNYASFNSSEGAKNSHAPLLPGKPRRALPLTRTYSPTMANTSSLFCVVVDEVAVKIGSPFLVSIPNDAYVCDLKKEIKKEKAPELDHLAADRLTLFGVSIPIVNIDENLSSIGEDKKLNVALEIGAAFSEPQEGNVQVIATVPTRK